MKTTRFDTAEFSLEMDITRRLYRGDAPKYTLPVKYILILTNLCNLDCSFCFMSHINPTDRMTANDWVQVIKQIPDYGRIILMGGEPLFLDGFENVLKSALNRHRVTIVTNGTLLTSSVMDTLLASHTFQNLVVSVDDTGNRARDFTKSQWEKLVRDCQEFVDKRNRLNSTAKLNINTLILDSNSETLFELHKFLHEELRCDAVNYCTLQGAPMQLTDDMKEFECIFEEPDIPVYQKWNTIKEQLDLIRTYNRTHGLLCYFRPKLADINDDVSISVFDPINTGEFSHDTMARCLIPWADLRIYGDGTTTTCLSTPLGNAKSQTLKEIVSGERMKKFRETIKAHKFVPQCKNCVSVYGRAFDLSA